MADTSPDEPTAPATQIPPGLVRYGGTATLTEATVPAALRQDHSTKPGTWGLIRVEQGRLRYRVTDPRRRPSERDLTPDAEPGVVEPTILHHVEPIGPVRFHVEFLRQAAPPVPLCRHEQLAEQENRARSRD